MTSQALLRGFTTVTYFVDDVPAAISWYADVLGVAPYFVRPSAEAPEYAEFRLGDDQDELGLIAAQYRPPGHRSVHPAGPVVYWHVDDVPEAIARLVSAGARELEPPTARSGT